MKKIRFLITAFLILVSVGCNSSSQSSTKPELEYEYGISDVLYSTVSEVKEKINNKDDFLLYIGSVTCTACISFHEDVLIPYILKNNSKIYRVESSNSLKEFVSYQYTPTLVVYIDGKEVKKADPFDASKPTGSVEYFTNFVTSYFTLKPIMMQGIVADDLRNKISQKESFLVLYSSSSCSDCKIIKEVGLKERLDQFDGKVKNFYVVEVDGYRVDGEKDENGNNIGWQKFKDEFKLSDKDGNLFGYGNGVVPTLQFYNKGVLEASSVYRNDKILKSGPTDQPIYTVESSFYSIEKGYVGEKQIIGKVFQGAAERDEFIIQYHNARLNEFMDEFLLKVN